MTRLLVPAYRNHNFRFQILFPKAHYWQMQSTRKLFADYVNPVRRSPNYAIFHTNKTSVVVICIFCMFVNMGGINWRPIWCLPSRYNNMCPIHLTFITQTKVTHSDRYIYFDTFKRVILRCHAFSLLWSPLFISKQLPSYKCACLLR